MGHTITDKTRQPEPAVTHEDALSYDESPQWFAPAREALGGAYLQLGDCPNAKSTFENELRRHRKSGRALYGLMRALKRDGKPYAEIEKQFKEAWQRADYTMTEEALWPPRNPGDGIGSGTACPPMPEEPR